MSDFDKMLEQVARKLSRETRFSVEERVALFQGVLRETILPLLEAGQANRDANMLDLDSRLEWDAAKQAAMEGR